MDKRKRGILYGLALGDGGIYTTATQASNTARMTIGHGPKQYQYLEEKASLLHSVLGGKKPSIYTYTSKNKSTGKTYTNHQLYKNHKYFRQMHKVLYVKGEKRYTEKLLGYLTDQSVALWFMDDGNGTVCKNSKTKKPCGCMTRLSTYCSEEEAQLLKSWFDEKYKLNTKFDVDKRNNKYSLRWNTKDSKTFTGIVYPYVFQSMKYKLQHVDEYSPRVQSILRDEDIV